jgi:hypothetical protein
MHEDQQQEIDQPIKFAMVSSMIMGLFVGMLLDGGAFSIPGPYFFFPFAGYMFIHACPKQGSD